MPTKLDLAATIIWAGSTCFGAYLLFVWLAHGGLRQQATRITVFPATLVFAHPVLATTGLTFWVLFLSTQPGELRVDRIRGAERVGDARLRDADPVADRPGGRHARGAEQHFPARIVAAHGAVGLATFALVLIAATLATRH